LIVVCGEALIDMISNGDGTQQPTPGGGPFNTARALARLGVPTAFLGRLSDDVLGRQLASLLAADGASLAMATSGPEPTTIAVAEVDGEGLAEYQFFVDGTSAPNLTSAMLPDSLPAEVDAIHFGTLGLALEPMASTLVELVRRESGRRMIMLDPNVRPGVAPDQDYRERIDSVIPLSTVVKASVADLAWIYPGIDYEAAAERLLGGGVRLVVVTLGALGAFGATAKLRTRVAAPLVEVIDTIGAGDIFGAAVLTSLYETGRLRPDLALTSDELTSLLSFACEAAAIACTRVGAESPMRSELSAAPKR
jgi:fructokinase